MKLLVIALMLVCAAKAQSSCNGFLLVDDADGPMSMSEPVLACSRYLSCLINRICDNSLKLIKRDTSYMMNKLVSEDLQSHVSTKRVVEDIRNTWHRPKRQVIDECCLKPCTVQTLISYCPRNSKIFDIYPRK